jgi:aminoglycoside 6-adenylyltransferase
MTHHQDQSELGPVLGPVMPEHRTTGSETAVLDRLVGWATAHPSIRALVLYSSRTNPHAVLDRFSDYDVLLVVPDPGPFVRDESWLAAFGPVLVRLPDDSGQLQGLATHTRLVLYGDGTKIDYTLWSVAHFQRVLGEQCLPEGLDLGYRVLVDKDGLAATLKPPTHRAYIPAPPTARQFHDLIEEFWWESTYVAKNIWRGELIEQKHNLDSVMKAELMTTLFQWRIEIDHQWSIRPGGTLGKGLKTLLEGETWTDFAQTYVGADPEQNWEALLRTISLCRRLAREVAQALGYAYPEDLDQRVSAYLQSVRSLDRSATLQHDATLDP